jgi:hypothetical protein
VLWASRAGVIRCSSGLDFAHWARLPVPPPALAFFLLAAEAFEGAMAARFGKKAQQTRSSTTTNDRTIWDLTGPAGSSEHMG